MRLGEQVVVVVVVQDAEAVAVGERGDEQVDGREAVVADAGELALGVERGARRRRRSRSGEGEQLVEERVVVARVARGVARLEQERQAGGDPAGLEGVGELARALVGEARRGEPDPGASCRAGPRAVTGAAQPERRTSSAAAGSTGRSRRRMRSARLRRGGRRRPRARPARGRASPGRRGSAARRTRSRPSPELVAQLVQRRADGRRLGDRVARVLGRDATSVTPVWHRRRESGPNPRSRRDRLLSNGGRRAGDASLIEAVRVASCACPASSRRRICWPTSSRRANPRSARRPFGRSRRRRRCAPSASSSAASCARSTSTSHASASSRPRPRASARSTTPSTAGARRCRARSCAPEGDPPSADAAVNEAYDGAGATFEFYRDVYERNSIDGNGLRARLLRPLRRRATRTRSGTAPDGLRRRRRPALQPGRAHARARRDRPRADPRRHAVHGRARVQQAARRAERELLRRLRRARQAVRGAARRPTRTSEVADRRRHARAQAGAARCAR